MPFLDGPVFGRKAASILTLSSVLLIVATLMGPVASADTGTKPFAVNFEPGITVTPATTLPFTATIVNNASQQQLGSMNIYAAASASTGASFTIPDQDLSSNPPTVNGTATGTAVVVGGVVWIRNLAAPPGATIVVQFRATSPCVAASDYTWKVIAKQANNYNGPPGNDFTQPPSGDQTVEVSGGCQLEFRVQTSSTTYDSTQPTNAQRNARVTTVPGDPNGARVMVEVEDGSGTVLTSFSGPITLSFSSSPPGDPSGGTAHLCGSTCDPSNTVTVSAVGGIATFGELSIDTSHSGYRLLASSSVVPSSGWIVSNLFGIFDKVCQTGDTNCSLSQPKSMASAVDTSGEGTYFLSLNADSIDCGDSFNHAPGTVSLDSTSATTKVDIITIDKFVVQQTPNNGVSFYQVCYQTDPPNTFTDRYGSTTSLGLLPDCPSKPTAADAPCIRSKNKDKAGNVIIKLLLPPGDPKAH